MTMMDIRYVNELGHDRYKVRMVVPPNLREIVGHRNLTRVIEEPDAREARARINQTVGEFEGILADARRDLAGSAMVYRTIHPPRRLEYHNLDPEISAAIRRLVQANYPNLDPPTERGIFGMRRVHQRADTPAPVRQEIIAEPVGFNTIIDAWARERQPRTALGMFEAKMAVLAKFLGHDDIRRVSRDDLNRFKEHLLAKAIKPVTVKNYLLVIKTLFNWAAENGRIKDNPAKLVKFQPKKDPLDKRQVFTLEERILILTEARKASPLIRWAVWVSYFSGCRLSEITQAKTSDIRQEGEHLMLSTGTKTEGSVRRFPLHSAILREGFVDYWKSQQRSSANSAGASQPDLLFPVRGNHSQILNGWLRDLGIEDRRKVFHSLRHGFKTLCREAKIEREIHDAITGHRDGSASSDYGDFPIPVMAEAVERIPNPTNNGSSQRRQIGHGMEHA
jgi:integrase